MALSAGARQLSGIIGLLSGLPRIHCPLCVVFRTRIFAREKNGVIEVQPIDPQWMSYRLPAAGDERPALHRWLHRASRFYRWLYAKLTLQYPSVAAWIGREPTEASRTAARIAALANLAPEEARLLEG